MFCPYLWATILVTNWAYWVKKIEHFLQNLTAQFGPQLSHSQYFGPNCRPYFLPNFMTQVLGKILGQTSDNILNAILRQNFREKFWDKIYDQIFGPQFCLFLCNLKQIFSLIFD